MGERERERGKRGCTYIAGSSGVAGVASADSIHVAVTISIGVKHGGEQWESLSYPSNGSVGRNVESSKVGTSG
jgi:hypothetical protein